MTTIIHYFISRLKELGLTHIFNVPGDYNFHMLDIMEYSDLKCYNATNELNGSYMTDGYARVRGVGCMVTTYGVGELSCVNGFAGMYAERVFGIHAVGLPSDDILRNGKCIHHSLGNNNMLAFYTAQQSLYTYATILSGSAEEMTSELDKALIEGYIHQRPIYLGFPTNCVDTKVELPHSPLKIAKSDQVVFKEITQAIQSRMTEDSKVIAIVGAPVRRLKLSKFVERMILNNNIPFTTYYGDKGIIWETLPNFIGVGNGDIVNKKVAEYMKSCDYVINIGGIPSDFHTGGFTLTLDPAKVIDIRPSCINVFGKLYQDIFMYDIIPSIAPHFPIFKTPLPGFLADYKEKDSFGNYFYENLTKNTCCGDIIVVETGSSNFNLAFQRLQAVVRVISQTVWGSIGWATAAAIGAQVAYKGRVICVTGEGSHQLSLQEVASCGRYQVPVQFYVINNDGYLIERMLCKDPEIEYNNIAKMDYSKIPGVFHFDAHVDVLRSEADVDEHFKKRVTGPVYCEVITERYDSPYYTTILKRELDRINKR